MQVIYATSYQYIACLTTQKEFHGMFLPQLFWRNGSNRIGMARDFTLHDAVALHLFIGVGSFSLRLRALFRCAVGDLGLLDLGSGLLTN